MPDTDRRAAGTTAKPGGVATLLERIPLMLRMLFYGVFFLAGVLAGLPWLAHRLDVLVPAGHVEVGWLRVVGVVVFLVSFVLYVRCSYVLSRRGRGAYVEFDPPKEFVASGPYRWCRNPVAGCIVLMLLGEAIAFSSTGITLLFVVAIPLAHMQVVFLEEPLLRKRFGQAYLDYLERVPRWFPRAPNPGSP
ncbi:MAG: isoprenylcysteine carboxylmethyltransferase family protein [Planctomycetes bacterium]|nr:isoprenylcysteine carboxylmethyltransferase family protein [Planctomycetota bacterium]